MKKILFLYTTCLILIYCKHISEELKPIVEEVNNANTTWTAGYNERHSQFTLETLKGLCGAQLEEQNYEEDQQQSGPVDSIDIPDHFDSREKWPNCESIREIRDQSDCGSCWAFGAAEAMSDRICITSNQTDQTRISANNLLSCCDYCGNGCKGGNIFLARLYYEDSGLVSGDQYNDTKGCQGYAFPPCAHHSNSNEYPPCKSLDYVTPSCTEQCSAQSGLTWSQDIRKGQFPYFVIFEQDMQLEILENGPIEAAFVVYEDFETYKSGVYQHVTGKQLGGHAIKILGWGIENGVKYWLVANSWNDTWGENGYFKILRGINHLGIEMQGVAGFAQDSKFSKQ